MNVAPRLLAWFDRHGRHDLPWQHPRTPYRCWIAEIMLQQTRVGTVIPYFERFMQALPDLPALAAASEDQVLALWSGLGYYRRARFARQAARECVARHDGHLPEDPEALQALPGIGRSTAAAILAQAHGQRHAILDGNVKRVLARFHGIRGWPGQAAVEKRLWELAEQHTPHRRLVDYTQAIMDLGATVCSRSKPDCAHCPLREDCVAYRQGTVENLPEPRPNRALPTRRAVLLLLQDRQGRVLLQKRGPQGVWGGLWSLPEAENKTAARKLAQQLADIGKAQPLPVIHHAFSHYRLEATPLCIPVHALRPGLADHETRWLTPRQAAELGLPAPVRKLLQTRSAHNKA